MFLNVLQNGGPDDDEIENDAGVAVLEKQKKRQSSLFEKKGIVKNKIQFVSKMLRMQKLLREESENILKIKAMNDNKLPQGILSEGKEVFGLFTEVKKNDLKNEMRPY